MASGHQRGISGYRVMAMALAARRKSKKIIISGEMAAKTA